MTVVFVDLAGSTELAARLDPERFREVLAAFHGMVHRRDRARSAGARRGSSATPCSGVFGVPTLHDDDALRGIRAALAIVGPDGAARRRGSASRCRCRCGSG